MFDDTTLGLVRKLLDYSLLGVAVIVLGYLYWRSLAEIRALNTLVLELTRVTTKVITENTAALSIAAASQKEAAEASRDVADLVRSTPVRRGR